MWTMTGCGSTVHVHTGIATRLAVSTFEHATAGCNVLIISTHVLDACRHMQHSLHTAALTSTGPHPQAP